MPLRQITLRFLAIAAMVVVVVAGSPIPSAQAATLYSSSMKAPPLTAGNLVGQDGWAAHSGAGSGPIQVGSNGTTLVAGNSEDAYVGFTQIAAGQTYYYGFDVSVVGEGAVATPLYFAGFKLATASTYTTRAWVTTSAGADFTFGLSSTSGSTPPTASWATGLTFGQTYRVVGSYSYDNGDTRLWVDPTNEASSSISVPGTGTSPFAAFALRQSTADSNQLISNLAVGTSFTDVVTPVPEPSAALLACSAVGLLGGLGLRRRVGRG